MTSRTIATAGLLLSLFFALPARAEHYEVFILAGQSNMDGRGKVADLAGDLGKYAKPREAVRIAYSTSGLKGPAVTSEGWKPLQPGYSSKGGTKIPGDQFGPEVGFGHALADALPGKRIALIKFCQGGTNLKKQWHPDEKGQIYEKFIPFVKNSLESLTKNGDTYTLRGMCWHQGEGDAGGEAGRYQKLLTHFIERVRKDLNAPQLPFAIGELSVERPERESIRADQKATSKAVPHAMFVSAEGLKTYDKGTHFDAANQIELGKRFAQAMLPTMKETADK